jgi:hypothetical protein
MRSALQKNSIRDWLGDEAFSVERSVSNSRLRNRASQEVLADAEVLAAAEHLVFLFWAADTTAATTF